MRTPPEPTAEQCSDHAPIVWDDGKGFAIWYPQMGGYVGKCVVVPCGDEPGDCFEAFVWHDGEFPFSEDNETRREDGGRPIQLHHCMSAQFVRFGQTVAKLMGG